MFPVCSVHVICLSKNLANHKVVIDQPTSGKPWKEKRKAINITQATSRHAVLLQGPTSERCWRLLQLQEILRWHRVGRCKLQKAKEPTSDNLQPRSDGLQPTSDVRAMASNLEAILQPTGGCLIVKSASKELGLWVLNCHSGRQSTPSCDKPRWLACRPLSLAEDKCS